jgi:hypothetical protein
MTNLNELPNDVESLKQLVVERNATLEAMGRALHEVQLHLDHLALLLKKSRGIQLPSGARAVIAPFAHPKSMRLKNMANFAEGDCNCPQCTGRR